MKLNKQLPDSYMNQILNKVEKLETDVNVVNESLNANGTTFKFGVNEKGEYGYIVTDSEGADTFNPFRQGEYTAEEYNANYTKGYNAGYSEGMAFATSEFPISFNCEGQNENNTGRVIWTYNKNATPLQMVKVTNFTLFYGSWTSVAMSNNYYYIQGSNDNSSWTNIYSKQISTAANYGDTYGCQNATVELNSQAFKYFRIVVSTTKKMDYRASGTFTFKNAA